MAVFLLAESSSRVIIPIISSNVELVFSGSAKGGNYMDIGLIVDRYQTAISNINRSVNVIIKQTIHTEMNTEQFSTLQYIERHRNCTNTEIAQAFAVGKSTVTAQLTKLYEKDFIQRTRNERDRRTVYLSTTPKGAELVKSIESKLYEEIGQNLDMFDQQEVLSFLSSLEKLSLLMAQKETAK